MTDLQQPDGQLPLRRRRKGRKAFGAIFVIFVVLAIVGAGGSVYFSQKTLELQSQIDTLQSQMDSNEQSAQSQEAEIQQLQGELLAAQNQIATQEELLAKREGFVAVVGEAAALLESARGKVDVAGLETAIRDGQDRVSAERTTPAVVDELSAAIVAARDGVSGALAAYEENEAKKRADAEAQARRTTQTQSNSGGSSQGNRGSTTPPRTGSSGGNSGGGSTGGNSGGGSAPQQPQQVPGGHLVGPRAALDEVGGGWVALYSEDVVCSWTEAVACSYYDGKIIIANKYAGESKEWWLGYMAHEYAHQIQYRQWDRLNSGGAPQFDALFGRDIEWLADCMAQNRYPQFISGYGYSCSQQQLDYSGATWGGNFA